MSPPTSSTSNLSTRLEVDLASVKRDVEHITKTISRMGQSIETVVDLAKTIAVQEARFEILEQKIGYLEKELALKELSDKEFRESTMTAITKLQEVSRSERQALYQEVMNTISEHKKSVDHLTKWYYYVTGVVAVGMFVMSQIPLWDILTVAR